MATTPVTMKAAAAAVPPSPEKAGKPTTLLDKHEVEWITRELERLLVRESGAGGAGADARHHHHHHHHRQRKRVKVVSPVRSSKPDAKANKRGGFLSELLGKHASSICGDGAVAGAVVTGRRRRGRAGFREVDKV